MVDYSRWDQLSKSISDDDDAERAVKNGAHPVHVTRFDAPVQVVLGPAAKPTDTKPSAENLETEGNQQQALEEEKKARPTRTWWVHETLYEWSQDSKHVWIRFFLPDGTRGKDVKLVVRCRQDERMSEVYEVSVVVAGKPLHDIILPHAVEVDKDGFADWSIVSSDNGIRCAQLELVKKVPVARAYIWWTCAAVGHTKIKLEDIPERKERGNDEFVKTWNAAHAAFRERTKRARMGATESGSET